MTSFEQCLLCIKCAHSNASCLFSVIYRPLKNSRQIFIEELANLLDYVHSLHSAEISSVEFTDDFNLDLLDAELDVAVMNICNLMYLHFYFPPFLSLLMLQKHLPHLSITFLLIIFFQHSQVFYIVIFQITFQFFQLFFCNLVS